MSLKKNYSSVRSIDADESCEIFYTALSFNEPNQTEDIKSKDDLDNSFDVILVKENSSCTENSSRRIASPPPSEIDMFRHLMITSTPLARPGMMVRSVHLTGRQIQFFQQKSLSLLLADSAANLSDMMKNKDSKVKEGFETNNEPGNPTRLSVEEFKKAEQKYQKMYGIFDKPISKKIGLRL